MLKFLFENLQEPGYQVLCLGAHSDDIEIGCGGTILRLIQEYSEVSINWVVFGAHAERSKEALESANEFLATVKNKNIVVKGFRDGYLPYNGGEVKDFFEQLKGEVSPDLIFTHYRQDLHQDHRLISELTWNTFRDHLILEYEIPKYDGDLGSPNFFVHLEESVCRQKIELILDHFVSQKRRQWFTADTFYALLRLRGVESNAPQRYAEAFYCRKFVF
jgi:LmbE family N-acetylglucosaminyl deacetylase